MGTIFQKPMNSSNKSFKKFREATKEIVEVFFDGVNNYFDKRYGKNGEGVPKKGELSHTKDDKPVGIIRDVKTKDGGIAIKFGVLRVEEEADAYFRKNCILIKK